MSIRSELSSLELIYEGLEEFFTSNSRTTFEKREILEFLNKTFCFCDFDMNSTFDGIWNNYLRMILDYYAIRKNMNFSNEKGQLKLTLKNTGIKEVISKQVSILKTKYKDLTGYIEPTNCLEKSTP